MIKTLIKILDLIKRFIKIQFSTNFGMQISAKIWDYLKKIIKILIPLKIQRNISLFHLNPFIENSKILEYKQNFGII